MKSKFTPQWNNDDWNTPIPTTDNQVRIEALEREVAELKEALLELAANIERLPTSDIGVPFWRDFYYKLLGKK